MPDGGSVFLRVFYTFPYFDNLNRSIGELIDRHKKRNDTGPGGRF